MSQPQHTRNEPHAGIAKPLNILGDPIYEKYTDARVTANQSFDAFGDQRIPFSPPPYTGYPIPKFEDYKDFWSSGVAATATGKGLADYSNHGFLTVSNNIGSTNYAMPSPHVKDYLRKVFTFKDTKGISFSIPYLVHTVNDFNTGVPTENVKAVAESVFYDYTDTDKQPNPDFMPYVMDRFVLDEMGNLTIPRAVAYSAGLINHFFRGKMQIDAPASGVYSIIDHSTIGSLTPVKIREGFTGFAKIKLKLSNITPNNEAMPAGKLLGVLKFKRNYCYTADLKGYLVFKATNNPLDSEALKCLYPDFDPKALVQKEADEEIIVSDTVLNAKGSSLIALSNTAQEFSFTFPKALPINARDVRLQVVYKGQLGKESDAVVVATKDISEPTFYVDGNYSNFIRIKGNLYTEAELNLPANSNLLNLIQPASCVNWTLTPPKYKAGCLIPFNVAINDAFGAGGLSIQVPALLPNQFYRAALLMDAGQSVSALAPKCGKTKPISIGAGLLQYDGVATQNYAPYFSLKGVVGSYVDGCAQTVDPVPYNFANEAIPSPINTMMTQVPLQILGF